MQTDVMSRTTTASLNGEMKFPEVVQTLAAIGLESYRVDLVMKQKIFYMPDGQIHVEDFKFSSKQAPAKEFSEERLISAVRSVQADLIDYQQFLEEILAAGVTHYSVFIQGHKTLYCGRLGDFYVESFPAR